jgi:hypothetical protein
MNVAFDNGQVVFDVGLLAVRAPEKSPASSQDWPNGSPTRAGPRTSSTLCGSAPGEGINLANEQELQVTRSELSALIKRTDMGNKR